MTKGCEARVLAGPGKELHAPSGLAFWQGTLLIADMDNRRIARLLPGGPCDFDANMPPFVKPLALTADACSVWVADAAGPALWRWQAGEWSRPVSPDILQSGLSLPGSVALSDTGVLYFTDFLQNRVWCRTPQGDLCPVESIRCEKPYGICAQGSQLYVTDTGHGRILHYSPQKDQCDVLLERGPGWNPIALAASGDWLYISTGRTLFRYHLALEYLETMADAAAWRSMGLGKLCHLGAICAQGGRVVVTDTIRNTVTALLPAP